TAEVVCCASLSLAISPVASPSNILFVDLPKPNFSYHSFILSEPPKTCKCIISVLDEYVKPSDIEISPQPTRFQSDILAPITSRGSAVYFLSGLNLPSWIAAAKP